MGRKGVVPRKFSVEKKIEILKEHLEEGISVPVLAEKYNLEPNVIKKWRRIYLEQGQEGLTPKPKGRRPGSTGISRPKTQFENELEQLRYENARLQFENLLLKKLQNYLKGEGRSQKKR